MFGTGPIGTALADLLAGRGEEVAAADRSGRAATGASVEVVAGDASDPEFTASVVTGAAVTYQCLNPPYTKWPELFPGLQASDGRVWHLPNAPTITTRQFIAEVYEAADTEGGVSALPRLMVNVFELFNANVREVKELLFEFEEPFVVDSSAYDSTFGESATRLDDAIPATVEWFRANPKT